MSVLKINEINYDNVKLGKVGKSTKLLYVTENSKANLKVATPKLSMMFLNSVTKEWANFTEFSMDCNIKDDEEMLVEFSNNLKQRIIEENRSTYEEQSYFSMVKENKNYPKLIKLVFPRDSQGNFETVVFDKEKNKIMITEDNIEDIFKRYLSMKCIIECSKVWSVNGKYGLIWNVVQILCGDIETREYKPATNDTQTNQQSDVYSSGACLID